MRTWFKPFYSGVWHLEKNGRTLCRTWKIVLSMKQGKRPDDAPENCPQCLRLAQKQEGSVNGKD